MANARLAMSLWETWLTGPRKVVCSLSEMACCWDWWGGWDEWDERDGCWDMARLLWAIGEGQSWGPAKTQFTCQDSFGKHSIFQARPIRLPFRPRAALPPRRLPRFGAPIPPF